MSDLRCRVGDLAIVVNSSRGVHGPCVGRIVRCIRFIPSHPFCQPWGAMDSWITEPMLKCEDGRETPCPDSYLRPIRPSDEPDEILALAGKPQEVAA